MIGDDKISVGPPYYNRTFVPIMVPLLLMMAIGPALKWKRDEVAAVFGRLKLAAAASAVAVIVVLSFTVGHGLLAAIFMGIAAWLVGGSFLVCAQRMRLGSAPLSTSIRLAGNAPRAFYGLVIAHAGMGVIVAGVTGMSAWATEKVEMMRPGQSIELSGYDLHLHSISNVAGPNYDAERGNFEIAKNGRVIARLFSERRYYPVRRQQTTAAGIRTNLLSNLYVALGEPDGAGAWTVRFYYHPFMPLVWIGALTMALGGFVSLSDRRLRVGAPRRAQRAAIAVSAE
jgi:cytochrome c-type biogenesis protein CcmF